MSSSGCGLKNSGCPSGNGESSSSSPIENTNPDENNDGTLRRFLFVDGVNGLWSTLTNYASEITCPVGSFVVFYYPQYWHDVVALPTLEAYDGCDLSQNVTVLSPTLLPNSTYPDVSYYYNCSQPNTTVYLTCSVPGHCQAGQKVKIHTSATDFVWDEDANEWIIHVQSLRRLLRLLNYHETDQGFFVMDHGYQTEELAEQTLQLIWCAMDHCPSAAWDVAPNASLQDCEAMIYTLMGFVSRKRPIPQWDQARDYYHEAIARGGSNLCAAQSYLAQLYWSRGPTFAEMARNQTQHLCQECAASDPLLVQQAKLEFDRQVAAKSQDWTEGWPEKECLAAAQMTGQTSMANTLPSAMVDYKLLCFSLLLIWKILH